MKTKKPKASAKPSGPIVIETFSSMGAWEQSRIRQDEPSCFNGIVSIRKTRVTIEAIEETTDVLFERLLKLWRESDNFHHRKPLHCVAQALGRELPSGEFGINRPPRR